MTVLSVAELRKSYARGFIPRKTEILKGLSFQVRSGSVTGFLGANGAGKTTTMRCLLGLDFADSGQVEFFGEPLSVETKSRIGFLPERPYFYEHLTGVEFLKFYGQLTRRWSAADLKTKIDQLLSRVDLTFAKDRPLRNYSKGMLQKIGLAQALIHDPEFVILDEPMSGLDPDGRMALADLIQETANKGTAVFFSSHLLHDTEKLCQNLVVIKDGICIYEGGTDALLDQSGVEHEVVYTLNGERRTIRKPDVGSLQMELGRLIKEGSTILEVRRLRASLEEVFVKMALRGGRT